MGVRKATGFLTSDGRFFGPQDEAKANEHETLIRLREFCKTIDIDVTDARLECLADELYTRRKELTRILNGLDEPTVREEVRGK